MAGVGKLLKQAQRMQKKMEALQEELAQRELEVSRGGGAVVIKVNGKQHLVSLKIDEEFLKEDPEFVQETLLEAINSALSESREMHEKEMGELTSGMSLPGLM